MLSIIIPVYNEESSIVNVVKSVLSLDIEKEVIVIDDGSTDSTLALLNYEFGSDITLIRNRKNRGKGYCLKLGIKESKGDFIAFQDADFEYPPENLYKLYESAKKGNYDSVIGIRNISWRDISRMSLGSILANRFISKITGEPDVFSGQRVIKKEVLNNLSLDSNGFDIETEITLKLINMGYNIKWEDIRYIPRTRSEGKKIGVIDFFVILYRYIKVNKAAKVMKRKKISPVYSINK